MWSLWGFSLKRKWDICEVLGAEKGFDRYYLSYLFLFLALHLGSYISSKLMWVANTLKTTSDSQNVLRGKGTKEQLVETFSFTNSRRAVSGMFLEEYPTKTWRSNDQVFSHLPETVKNTSHRQNSNSKGHSSLAGFPMSHEIYKSVSSTNYPRQQSRN